MAASLLASTCAPVVNGETLRLTLLNDCGMPITGTATRVAVTESFVEVQNSPQYEDGQRFLLRTAGGDPCVNQLGPSFLNWFETTTSVCTIDPSVIAMLMGMEQIGAVTGTGFVIDDILLTRTYAMETWQPVAGSGACSAAGVQQYLYSVWFANFDTRLGDMTISNDTFTLPWSAKTKAAPSNWLTQMNATMTAITQTTPGTYLGTATQAQITGAHFAANFTASPPPAAYCGLTTSTV